MRPGKDGLNFRLDLLPEVAAALGETVKAAPKTAGSGGSCIPANLPV